MKAQVARSKTRLRFIFGFKVKSKLSGVLCGSRNAAAYLIPQTLSVWANCCARIVHPFSCSGMTAPFYHGRREVPQARDPEQYSEFSARAAGREW